LEPMLQNRPNNPPNSKRGFDYSRKELFLS
jgi:hypothetical protein